MPLSGIRVHSRTLARQSGKQYRDMKHLRTLFLFCLPLVVASCAHAQEAKPLPSATEQVRQAELAFAASMAERDFGKFRALLSDEAVFFGSKRVMRGKAEVAEVWKRFFEGPKAPFSWAPDSVEVLASGTLAHSSGPVYDPDGKLISRFNSIWRLEAPGVWRIVFDKGDTACDCAKP